MEFRAPIPGQSLTDAPGSRPWERPPEMTDPEEVIQMYLTKLSSDKATEGILDLIELDTDIRTLTEGILRASVSEGLHSIDVSLVVAPVIHEFIKQTAEAAGMDYEEGLEDKQFEAKKKKAMDKARIKKMVRKAREGKGIKEPEMPAMEEEDMVQPEMPETEGFMKRRGAM